MVRCRFTRIDGLLFPEQVLRTGNQPYREDYFGRVPISDDYGAVVARREFREDPAQLVAHGPHQGCRVCACVALEELGAVPGEQREPREEVGACQTEQALYDQGVLLAVVEARDETLAGEEGGHLHRCSRDVTEVHS
ncbi:hypothetical protein V5799_013454 [Amblyomma americanum]|uniref:Uncharacterized protein n=1 Tax=Amblyomma americanum TaxID=6943 RepID=A0AAQ4E5U7_AMBAM